MDINFKAKAFQTRFLMIDKPHEQIFPAFVGGWGTGKSLTAIARGLAFSKESPGNLGLICRKEFTDLRDSTIQDFEKYTGLKINRGDKEIELYKSKILFRHADELNTLQNINLGWFWIEQAEEMPDDKAFMFLQGRLRRHEAKRRSGWITANANGKDWIYKLWGSAAEPKNNPRFPLIEATTWDNADNLPQDFLNNLKELEKTKPELYKQYVMNSRDVMVGLVWPNFDEKYHVIPEIRIPKEWEKQYVMDLATSGTVVCLEYVTDFAGNIIFTNEYYGEHRLIQDHCRDILNMAGTNEIYAWACKYAFYETQINQSFEKFGTMTKLADLYRDFKINLLETADTSDGGRQRVANLLYINSEKMHPFKTDLKGAPQIFFFERCKRTREQVSQYRQTTIESETGIKTVPVRKNDHCCECVTRAIMALPAPAKEDEKVTYDRFGRPNIGWYMKRMIEESKQEKAEQEYTESRMGW